ncbi:MAG: IgGFc-binding protein, partial [Bacteroidota bacterium]
MKVVFPFYQLNSQNDRSLLIMDNGGMSYASHASFLSCLPVFLLLCVLPHYSLTKGSDLYEPNSKKVLLHTLAEEICDNGIDDDGDGLIDCEDPDCGETASCLTGNVCAALGDNLVMNGDFEQGYFAFSSDLGRGSNHALSGECKDQGWFVVGRSMSIQNMIYVNGPGEPGSFTSSDPTDLSNTGTLKGNALDHTHGDGNFLVADPNHVVDAAIWYQDLVLCAGQKYVFSAWIKNIGQAGAPSPRLKLVIDGEPLIPFTEMGNREWEELSGAYIAKNSAALRVAIVNGGGCEGNDIAIDDISLKPCSTSKVEIEGKEVVCLGEDVSLSVSSLDSAITKPEFQWQRSEDEGQSWIDIPGEYYPFLVYSKPITKTQFRVLASDQGSINIPSCRFVSNVIEPEVLNCVAEICNNGLDDDKDGEIDEEDADCPFGDIQICSEGAGINYYLPAVWRNDRRGYPHSLFISTAFAAAHVDIRTADGSFQKEITITSTEPGEITLPKDVVASKNINTIEANRGLIITSDVPISPLYRISNRFNRMLANLKGNGAVGRNFRLATPVRAGGDARQEERHFFSVMATTDSTVVTIDECPFPLEGVTLPFSTTLSAGETILFYPAKVNHHITGTLVVADKPISVMAGTQHTRGNGTWNREAAGDVAIPFTKLGQHYVCIRGGFSSSLHDYAIVMAVMDGTQVYMDGDPMPLANLAAGEYTLVEITGNKGDPHYIRSTQDVYVYHVSGNMPSDRQMGEFGMAVLPPINSQNCTGIKSTAVPKFLEAGTLNDLYIIAPDEALASLKVDGQPYKNFTTEKRVPGYAGYSSIYLPQHAVGRRADRRLPPP